MSEENVLTKEIVEQYLADEDVDLEEFTELDDDVAESLSKYTGHLELNGLTSLSDAAAESLSKHEGHLSLDPDPPLLRHLPISAAVILRQHHSFQDDD